MDDYSRETLWRYVTRKPANRNITKTLKGEVWFVFLRATTFKCVLNCLFCRAQVIGIEVSLLIQDFGMPKRNNGTGWSLRFQSNPADHVLAHIGNNFSSWCLDNCDGRNFFVSGYWRTSRRN